MRPGGSGSAGSKLGYGPDLTVPRRFCGPAGSGNGGYTAGTLAERIEGAAAGSSTVEVTLRQPPPLDVAMKVRRVVADRADDTTGPAQVLTMGGAKIAEARGVDTELDPVDPVGQSRAEAAQRDFAGFREHPFPTCFACGPERAVGDGLRIFPGRVDDDRVAAVWTPDAGLAEVSDVVDESHRVGLGTTWAALDCIGGWAGDGGPTGGLTGGLTGGRRMVLGRMTARVDELPVVSEPHVVMGMWLGSEGRKTFTASTLYDSDGRIVARARHVWIAVDPSSFAA